MFHMLVEILKIKYVVPNSITFRKNEENKLACSSFPERIALHPKVYKLKLGLFFHFFLIYMLSNLACAPAQLKPNV